ncbi:hypothetical protein SGGMMB4_04542 [Sodalis glossinidius str. 'morsitans']|uniref:Uncharacterized protein n=1 Tax=Sodalis glossinidius (strain morsitans) TaxID=343509 RepID=A0A193QLR8_SODGM|nr:hypothetical protein [Sodalis glossinidius]CRL46159.1 hypothetical protein SGGMMB4_04542 [Sodalis glossinidius str. 'morsitans']
MKKIVALFQTALLCNSLWLVSQAHGAPAATRSVSMPVCMISCRRKAAASSTW